MAIWTKGFKKVIFEEDNKCLMELVNEIQKNFVVHYWIREI